MMISRRNTRSLAVAALLSALTGTAPAFAEGTPPATPSIAGAPVKTHHHARHHAPSANAAASLQPPTRPRPAPPPDEGPAPVPNLAVTAPVDNSRQQATEVQPDVFQLHYPPQGEGYVTGSSPQAMDDRNAAQATGVEVTVPLPQ